MRPSAISCGVTGHGDLVGVLGHPLAVRRQWPVNSRITPVVRVGFMVRRSRGTVPAGGARIDQPVLEEVTGPVGALPRLAVIGHGIQELLIAGARNQRGRQRSAGSINGGSSLRLLDDLHFGAAEATHIRGHVGWVGAVWNFHRQKEGIDAGAAE